MVGLILIAQCYVVCAIWLGIKDQSHPKKRCGYFEHPIIFNHLILLVLHFISSSSVSISGSQWDTLHPCLLLSIIRLLINPAANYSWFLWPAVVHLSEKSCKNIGFKCHLIFKLQAICQIQFQTNESEISRVLITQMQSTDTSTYELLK